MSSKAEVTQEIYEAQQRRLNDTINIADEVDVGPLKVSNDPIRVTYVAPNNVDLVVVDLPGIIHHGEGVEEVDEMIRTYIKSEMTLIVVVREADR